MAETFDLENIACASIEFQMKQDTMINNGIRFYVRLEAKFEIFPHSYGQLVGIKPCR